MAANQNKVKMKIKDLKLKKKKIKKTQQNGAHRNEIKNAY